MRFFGDFAVAAGGEPLATLNKPRLQSLLAYLILHRDSQQFRHHLAGLFYPDNSEAQALTNLRNLLFQLRQALPDSEPFFLINRRTIQWNPGIPLSLDVLEFQQLAAQDTLQNLSLATLETLVHLYRGDLLPSCYDEWISNERERYRQTFLAVLSQLSKRYESLRLYPEAIAACRQLIAADPLHADGYPRLVALLAMNGEGPPGFKGIYRIRPITAARVGDRAAGRAAGIFPVYPANCPAGRVCAGAFAAWELARPASPGRPPPGVAGHSSGLEACCGGKAGPAHPLG